MKEGDLLHIRGQNEDGTSTKWFAELVGIDEDGKLEVYLLEQTNKMEGHIWAYASDWQTIDKETVLKVITPDKNHYVKSYKEYGGRRKSVLEGGRFYTVSYHDTDTVGQ